MTLHIVMEEIYGQEGMLGVCLKKETAKKLIEEMKTRMFELHLESGRWQDFNYYTFEVETLD